MHFGNSTNMGAIIQEYSDFGFRAYIANSRIFGICYAYLKCMFTFKFGAISNSKKWQDSPGGVLDKSESLKWEITIMKAAS